MSAPRISVVVPVPPHLRDTEVSVRSLELQAYPDLEIILEGGADFGTALDRGFARATGDIRSFLPPGDSLLPGALVRVAAEISPPSDRRVVMGGGVFLLEGMEDVAIAHPAEYRGFAEHLRIWERGFDLVAYASLFWHRSVQEVVGTFTGEVRPAVAAYSMSCRIGARHAIHKVDEVWSATRVRAGSEGCMESEILTECIAVSRSYWGPWLTLRRWQCEASWRRHAWWAHDRARHHAREAEAALARRDRLQFLRGYLKTSAWDRRMARERLGRSI